MQLIKSSKIALAAASLLGAPHAASAGDSLNSEPDYPAQDEYVGMSSYWDELNVENSTRSSQGNNSKTYATSSTKSASSKRYTRKTPKTHADKNSESSDWAHEASLLYYGEGDDRVEDNSFKYKGTLTTEEGSTLGVRVGWDSLTGASPSGGAPLSVAQAVTSPSGSVSTVYPDNELVLDYGFEDERIDAGISWDQGIIDKKTRANVGVSVSKESDYLHVGVSSGISREFNNKDTTVSLGVAYSADTIEPAFNMATGLSDVSTSEGVAKQSKDTIDFVVGLSQILSKDTIFQLNYGLSQAEGYLNDPYKRISRVNSEGTKVVQNLNESRPNQRLGHNLFGAVRHNFSGDVLSTSARLHTDDFGIDSVTLDAKYNIKINKTHSIEPHIRYYTQTAADFYKPQLNADDPLPQYASSDYRLAEFNSYSIGATYRFNTEDDKEWRITTELYSQDPTEVERTEAQKDYNSNPGFNALMTSVGVKF